MTALHGSCRKALPLHPQPPVSSAASTASEMAGRVASLPRSNPRRASRGASGADHSPASTRRAMLIGMLERAEGASVPSLLPQRRLTRWNALTRPR